MKMGSGARHGIPGHVADALKSSPPRAEKNT